MALTLLGKPPSNTSPGTVASPSGLLSGQDPGGGRVTAPQPVNVRSGFRVVFFFFPPSSCWYCWRELIWQLGLIEHFCQGQRIRWLRPCPPTLPPLFGASSKFDMLLYFAPSGDFHSCGESILCPAAKDIVFCLVWDRIYKLNSLCLQDRAHYGCSGDRAC